MNPRHRQHGAALIMAMLTVVLTATLASAALWHQWRQADMEQAERERLQSSWILTGAMDWARLILREDARSNQNTTPVDHLGEPWAIGLKEARLSTFLSADASAPADTSDHLMQEKDPLNAFLSGQMHDLQAKINLHNQIEPMGIDKADRERNAQMLARLFQQLNLPMAELALIQSQLPQTMNPPDALQVPMRVERLEHLSRLGVSSSTIERLQPFVTVLQQSTAINMNTAPKEVIMASIDNMSAADAQHLMDVRTKQAFKTIEDIKQAMPPALAASVSATQLSTNTQYFETISTLRMGAYTMQERTWLNRKGTEVRMLWRQRMSALNHI